MPTTVGGFDLLEIPPTQGWPRTSDVDRAADTITTPPGVVLETTTADATTTHTLEWACPTRAELVTLETVLAARNGRRAAIWIPTYQKDVVVLFASSAGWIVPKRAGSAHLGAFVPTVTAWQWWIGATPGYTAWRIWRLSTVTDNGDGTETWNGSTPLGSTAYSLTSAQGGVFSRLCLCRMASDSYTVRHLGTASIVTASFVETPAEAP